MRETTATLTFSDWRRPAFLAAIGRRPPRATRLRHSACAGYRGLTNKCQSRSSFKFCRDKDSRALIRLERLSIRAGTFSLQNVSLEVAKGAYGILMGRTGSGKTTLLEAICGLRSVTDGRIILMDRDVTRLKPAARGIGFVPQDGAIFPTMKVGEQIGFALSVRNWKRNQIQERVDELAELLGVTSLLKRRPEGLSGGERQRIALGRALAANPGVLCLDEPLSALDDVTREEMYALLKSVRERTGVTTLHITHSQAEARRLGDIVFQVSGGKVVPISTDELSVLPEDSSPRDLAGSATRNA